jgi:hypothetical protein
MRFYCLPGQRKGRRAFASVALQPVKPQDKLLVANGLGQAASPSPAAYCYETVGNPRSAA